MLVCVSAKRSRSGRNIEQHFTTGEILVWAWFESRALPQSSQCSQWVSSSTTRAKSWWRSLVTKYQFHFVLLPDLVRFFRQSIMPVVGDSDNGAVPLITLNRRQNYQRLSDDNFDFNTEYSAANYEPRPQNMARGSLNSLRDARKGSSRSALVIASSYVFDWVIIFVILGLAYIMNHQEPNRRPFSIEDPNIS